MLDKKCLLFFAMSSFLFLVAGLGVGRWFGFGLDRVYVTDQDVSDRIAECSLTVRIFDVAMDRSDSELKRLVSGDVHQCHLLATAFSEKIRARDKPAAARILDAFERLQDSREPP